MGVIGRRCAMLTKESSALPERCQIAVPAGAILPGQLAKQAHIGDEIRTLRIDDIVGAKGRYDSAAPTGFRDSAMMLQRIESPFGARQHLDAEGIVERTRSKSGSPQGVVDGVEIQVGRVRCESHVQIEHLPEDVIQPQQQTDGILEGSIACKPGGIRVAVRAHDWQPLERREKLHGNPAHVGIRGEKPLWIKTKGSAHSRSVKWSGNIAIRHGSGQDSSFMAATPDTRKLYQQVASTIMASIIGGNYKPGERLPSERDLAVAFKVSSPTIREAMIPLEIRGLAESRPGSRIYVTGQPPAQVGPRDLDIAPFYLTESRRLFEGAGAALPAATLTGGELEE